MKLKVTVQSRAYDCDYGGEQILAAELGEHRLSEVFRLPFFRIIIDDIIEDALCFRLMEGGIAHYFVLEGAGDRAEFSRETGVGEDNFTFILID